MPQSTESAVRSRPRIAIVHDYLIQYGGAERVLDELHAIWPDAPVMVAIHDPSRIPAHYRNWDIRASWLSRLPVFKRKHQALLTLYPQAFESFDLQDYEVVVSSSSGFAHGVLTGPQTVHVCYCHSPPRFLWDYHAYARREGLGRLARAIIAPKLASLRTWDRTSAERADAWVSTSRTVQDRIAKFYGKPSTIIQPPVDVSRFDVGDGRGGYYLMLMRLVGWKRPEIVVEACTRLGLDLVVAGDGRSESHLRRIAGPTVRFVGRVDDFAMRKLYADCKAFILPSEEDFGIAPLEAMASGRPVIAYGRGGVLDTVVPGKTGLFFAEQTAESVAEVLHGFDACAFNPYEIRRHVEQFDSVNFRARFRQHVETEIHGRTVAPHGATMTLSQLPSAA
jgi:glycosyltransferase involved in cell wall biosynthesis